MDCNANYYPQPHYYQQLQPYRRHVRTNMRQLWMPMYTPQTGLVHIPAESPITPSRPVRLATYTLEETLKYKSIFVDTLKRLGSLRARVHFHHTRLTTRMQGACSPVVTFTINSPVILTITITLALDIAITLTITITIVHPLPCFSLSRSSGLRRTQR